MPSNENNSLLIRFANQYGIEAKKALHILQYGVFRQPDGSVLTHEQIMVVMVVVDQYKLNPFLKEIYALPDKRGGVIPVLSIVRAAQRNKTCGKK